MATTMQQPHPLSSNPPASPSSSTSLSADQTAKVNSQHLENPAQSRWAPGYGPLTHIPSNDSQYLSAFGGAFQPGLYKPPDRKFANPAPLGLSGFALTTFLLSLINLGVRGVSKPNIVVGPALAYGGLVQLLAGMWEIGLGNTYGGTALSSYGGFWISLGIIFTPGGFGIATAYGGETPAFYTALGFYIYGWFIFTFLIWLLTLRSTVAFSSLLFTVWLTYLMLATAYIDNSTVAGVTAPNKSLNVAGGAFGIVAAFLAWWNMLAGIADKSNSLFLVPVAHFPWSEKGRERRGKGEGRGRDVEKGD